MKGPTSSFGNLKKFIVLLTTAILDGGQDCAIQIWKEIKVWLNLAQQFQRRKISKEFLSKSAFFAYFHQKSTKCFGKTHSICPTTRQNVTSIKIYAISKLRTVALTLWVFYTLHMSINKVKPVYKLKRALKGT